MRRRAAPDQRRVAVGFGADRLAEGAFFAVAFFAAAFFAAAVLVAAVFDGAFAVALAIRAPGRGAVALAGFATACFEAAARGGGGGRASSGSTPT
jgi:hypothetical protein